MPPYQAYPSQITLHSLSGLNPWKFQNPKRPSPVEFEPGEEKRRVSTRRVRDLIKNMVTWIRMHGGDLLRDDEMLNFCRCCNFYGHTKLYSPTYRYLIYLCVIKVRLVEFDTTT